MVYTIPNAFGIQKFVTAILRLWKKTLTVSEQKDDELGLWQKWFILKLMYGFVTITLKTVIGNENLFI